jgi:hypothetical protein
MLEQLRDLIRTLSEEISYHENILDHQKSLEATLWGLEEQAGFPENTAPEEQQQIVLEVNNCRTKILNLRNLLQAHTQKMKQFVDSYTLALNKVSEEPPVGCGGCGSHK